jgi:NADH:ubiquinone oxidoreductase subunit 6 (subunit J)
VRNSVRALVGLVFVALVIGGYFTVTGASLPTVTQVTSRDASTLASTDEKMAQLAVVTVVMVGALFSMSIGMALTLWFLNRQVVKAHTQENRPVNLLMLPSGQTVGATIQRNYFIIAITIGLILIMIFVALALYNGAIS